MSLKSESRKNSKKRFSLIGNIALAGFVVLIFIISLILKNILLNQEFTSISTVLNIKSEELSTFDKERTDEARFIFKNPAVSEIIRYRADGQLDNRSRLFFSEMFGKIKANHDYLNMVLYSKTGKILFSFSDSLDGIDQDDIRTALDSLKIVKDRLFYSEKYGMVIKNFYLPVFSNSSELIGYFVLSANYNPVFFRNMIFRVDDWPIGISVLTQTEGRYLYFSSDSGFSHPPHLYPEPDLRDIISALPDGNFREWEGLTGENRYFLKRDLGEEGFWFVAEIAVSDLYGKIIIYLLYFSVLVLLAYAFVSLLIGREKRRRQIIELSNKLQYETQRANLIKKYEALFKSANDAIITFSPEGKTLVFNRKAEEYYGYSSSEIISMSFKDFTPEEHHEKLSAFLNEVLVNGSGMTDLQQKTKSGYIFDAQISASLQAEEGKEFVQAIIRDVTESRRFQSQIQNNERKFRRLANLTGELICEFNLTQNTITWDGPVIKITGYAPEELASSGRMGFLSLMKPETASEYIKFFEQAKSGHNIFRYEYDITRKDGTQCKLMETGELFEDKTSSTIIYISAISDITSVRNYEKQILANQQKYKYLLQSSEEGISILRPNGEIEIISKTKSSKLGYDEDNFTLESINSLLHPEDLIPLNETLEKVKSAPGNSERVNLRIRAKDGIYHWFEFDLVNRTDIPEINGIVISYRYLDELKRYEKIFYSLATSIYSSIGRNFLEELLRPLEDYLKPAILYLGKFTNDLRNQLQTIVFLREGKREGDLQISLVDSPCGNITHGSVVMYEKNAADLFPKDESLRKFNANAFFSVTLSDSSNKPIGLLTAIFQKQASNGNEIINLLKIFAARAAAELERNENEARLRKSQEMYESLVRNIPVAIFRITVSRKSEFEFHYASPKFYELTGIEPYKEPLTSAVFADTIYSVDRGKLLALIQSSLAAVRNFQWEGRAVVKGELRWFFIDARTYKNENQIVLSEVILKDITFEKAAEIELRESEEKFRKVWENLRDAIIITNSKAKVISASPAFFNYYGYKLEQVINKDLFKFMPSAAIIECDHILRDLYANKKIPTTITTSLFHRDGHILDVESSLSIISDKTGERLVLWLMRDVTEKKAAAKKIEVLTKQFAVFFENSPLGMAIIDKEMNYISVNKVVAEINGMKISEHPGKNLRHLFPRVAKNLEPLIQEIISGNSTSLPFRLTGNPPGRGRAETHFSGSVFGLYDENNNVNAIGLLFLDVTREVLAERELNARLDEITRTNKLLVGRELKMLELKKEVNQLLAKLNSPPKYNVDSNDKENK